MNVTGWRGATYGIRAGKQNAATFFDKKWDSVEIEIDAEVKTFNLSPKFWTTCPELRGIALAEWLLQRQLAPWPPNSS